jgi:hypothetical protein
VGLFDFSVIARELFDLSGIARGIVCSTFSSFCCWLFVSHKNQRSNNIQYIIITTMPSTIARRCESSEESSFTSPTRYPLQSSHQDERTTKQHKQQQHRGGQRRWRRDQHRSISPKPSAQATTMDILLVDDSESVLLGHESWSSITSNDYSISSMGKKAYRETTLKNICEQLGIVF